jgi:DNA-binding SARP family transcriptional activator
LRHGRADADQPGRHTVWRAAGDEVDIDVLGPLVAREGGVSVAPTAAKPRKVLAMLAVHADQVVPMASLFEELWGDDIPRSANTTVQTYILHLRNLIGGALEQTPASEIRDPKRILVTYPGGYLLDTMGGRVDVRDFDRLAAVGHRARELGDFETASKSFTEALAIWRGRALVDVQTGSLLEVEAHRLEEARLNVLDRRIDADLRLGRHHELLGELAGLVGRYRTHEGMHAHLMLALYRSGRRGEAIDVYRRLRTCLVNELGLEPSPSLRRMQHAILMSDPRLSEQGTEATSMVRAAG